MMVFEEPIKKIGGWLGQPLPADAMTSIEQAGNAMVFLVMLALVMVGIGLGAQQLLNVANITDPSKLPIVGGAFSGITQSMKMGAVALVVGFIGIILTVLVGVWRGFSGPNGQVLVSERP